MQQGGAGGPYQSISARALVSTALQYGNLSVGGGIPPADAQVGNIFGGPVVLGNNSELAWNLYNATDGTWHAWQTGPGGILDFTPDGGWDFAYAPSTSAGQPVTDIVQLLQLNPAGHLNLPLGTITVARDPSAQNEVATLNWVQNNTVHSFNNRTGAVQLTATDVYNALGYTDYIATQPWVINAINAAIGNLITTYPLVTTWNGRIGDVFLTLSDITCTFFQPGQQPIAPTPPDTSNDNSIATTQWVVNYITNELSGSGQTLATQPWVLANTVNSFNNRQGPVQLTLTDVTDVGAAPLNSPSFSGIPNAPTANPGTHTAQLATTAFVMNAVAGSVSGVSSFNTRTGAVTLTNADITGAGGLANPNVALTGNPTAPTQAPGTNNTTIATTAYVAAALTAGTVSSFNTRTGAVTLQLTDVTGVGGAPLANPTFTGTPAAPTAAPGTNTTQLATTGFVTAALTAAGGVSSFNSRTGAVTLTTNDVSAVGGLVNPSVNLTGVPTTPTAAPATNTTQIASTAFVQAAVAAGVISFNTRTGAITLVAADITGAGGALLASPTFTGTPAAPTAAPGTNNTTLATTAFVAAAIASGTAGVTSFNTRTGAVTLLLADITGAGGAPINNAALTGVPTAPTATAGTSTTQLATTAFVQAAVSAGAVTSFNSRTGAVTLATNDITAAGGAPIANPTFTGTPAAPTATAGTSTTQLATTAFVQAAAAPSGNNIGRNLITNGTFAIQQRGQGPWTTGGTYTADRWLTAIAIDTVSMSMVQLADSDRTAIGDERAFSAMQIVTTGAAGTSYTVISQRIEDVRRLGGKTATVSFWARATSGTPRLGVTSAENFGTGGSPSANVQTTVGATAALSATWTRYVMTFASPSLAGKTFGTNGDDWVNLQIWTSDGAAFSGTGIGRQTSTVQLWGLQLEVGAQVTPLDVGGSRQQILAACQRFYLYMSAVFYGCGGYGGGNGVYGYTAWPVTMRATPSIQLVNVIYQNATSISNAATTPTGTGLGGLTGSTITGSWIQTDIIASADL